MYEFIKEKEIEKIVLEHILNAQKVEEQSKDLLKHVFEQMVSRILLQVKLHIENANMFKSAERMYNELKKIEERMQQYILLDYKSDVTSADEKVVLKGVFVSIQDALEDFPDNSENPIEYERMLIISTGLLKIKETMNKLQEEVVHQFELPASIQVDFGELLNNHMIAAYDTVFEELDRIVTGIIYELNDVTSRHEIGFFLKFSEDLEARLKSFIHINLEIGNDWNAQKDANALTAKFIYPLRQLYQDIHSLISDVRHTIKKTYKEIPLEIKNIEKIISNSILNDKRLKELIETLEDDKNNTIDRIVIHINDELTKASSTELKRIKKTSGVFELLSCIVLELFEESLKCMDKIAALEVENENHKKIIRGIADTLFLKYESLKEKDDQYHMSKKEDYLYYGKGFIDFKNEFEQKCEEYLEEAIQGESINFKKAQSKFSRLVEKEFEENLSKDLNYLKQDIIFEIHTLEDLIYQSVDALRDSEEENCQEFAKCVVHLYETILVQLKRYEILQIRPKGHEMFNGKAHEILMVEEVEGFNKGEIIRTQNSGFLYDNKILVRASVIAAK